MKSKGNLYLLLIHVKAKDVEQAAKLGKKIGKIAGVFEPKQEIIELAAAIGIETSKNQWSDEEELEPETKLGY